MYCYLLLSIFLFSVTTTNSYNTKPKLCINCKYFVSSIITNTEEFGKCSLFPLHNNNFLVTGQKIEDYYYCSTARTWENMCGTNATKYVKNM
jgi:hypothetical protein